MPIRVALLLIATTLSNAWAQTTITELLSQVELDPRDVSIDSHDLQLITGQHRASPVTTWLLNAPLRSGDFTITLAERMRASAGDAPDVTLANLSRFTGSTLRLNLLGNPIGNLQTQAAEENALSDIVRKLGGRLSPGDLETVPANVQEAAALILLAIEEARPWQQRAAGSVGDQRTWRQLESYLKIPLPEAGSKSAEPDLEEVATWKSATHQFDLAAAMRAAQLVTLATSAARERLLADTELDGIDFKLQTRSTHGAIILAGSGDHVHADAGPILLIIDTGGADEYAQAGASSDRRHALSVALDLAGNDTYRADPQQLCSFGASVGGVGLLWDEAGDDVYEAARRSQGAGVFGVGVLIDGGGDDLYHATAESQAHAQAGAGLLIDHSGVDYYEAFATSQGFGGPRGAAALIDLAGNDRYVANDSDIRFPSAQDARHNASLCQGVGMGERADYTDGQSLAGGVGMLIDGGGDDAYECGVFGQGVGYWLGSGLLVDFAGSDQYTGHWYVQGASAHFAVGVLCDLEGNDQYTAGRNMSHGAGHDIGIGYLEDRAGDDKYQAATLSLGAGNAAGIGVFIDRAGKDEYTAAPESSFGWARPTSSLRAMMPSYGLFFDLGGTDTYAGRVGPGDGYLWTDPQTTAGGDQRQRGYGFDAE